MDKGIFLLIILANSHSITLMSYYTKTCLVPTLSGNFNEGSLADYLGIPISTDVTVNSLPFRMYAKVWDEWFRDENL